MIPSPSHNAPTHRPAATRNTFRPSALAALLLGFAEATLFFVVPDVAIGWAALRRGWRAGFLAAFLASLGAAFGGALVHAWSTSDPAGAARLIEAVPAIPSGAVSRAAEALRRDGLAAPLAGSFDGMPFKVWSAAAPQAGWRASAWFLAAFPVRLPRFALSVLGFALVGAAVRSRLAPRLVALVFTSGWTLFYAAYWTLSPW